MRGSRYIFKSEDNRDISAVKWIPEADENIIGAVQIVHGMAEHIDRYEHFARFLNSHGFVVVGNDHRGHGKSVVSEGDTGIFSEENGWEKTLNDVRKVTTQLKDQHRGLPVFIFSHSMGSYFMRDYISRWGNDINGVILSGTGNEKLILIKLLRFLASTEILFLGKRHRSTVIDRLSFSSYNKPFEPQARTPFEWLSRDHKHVDKYIEDPLCGYICTSAHYRDLADGLLRVCSPGIAAVVPKDLPVFLYSGDEDPMGGKNGKFVKEVYENYRKHGLIDVSIDFNRGGRHESLNEINSDEVYETFLTWMKKRLDS